MKVYLRASSSSSNGKKLQPLNSEIFEFFYEGLFSVKNYHLILLSLAITSVSCDEKEALVKKLLNCITVMNPNILILVNILYNLLISSPSESVFDNHSKDIIMRLFKSITDDKQSTSSSTALMQLGDALDVAAFIGISATKQPKKQQ